MPREPRPRQATAIKAGDTASKINKKHKITDRIVDGIGAGAAKIDKALGHTAVEKK